jgi:hypothetical protein
MGRAVVEQRRISSREKDIRNMMEEVYHVAHVLNHLEAEMKAAAFQHAVEKHRLKDIEDAGYTMWTSRYQEQHTRTSNRNRRALLADRDYITALRELNDLKQNVENEERKL